MGKSPEAHPPRRPPEAGAKELSVQTRHTRRFVGVATALALTLILGAASIAVADDDTIPSQAQVDAAKAAATDKARDVAGVQADLVLANQRLQAASIAAAKAGEAYNGAVYRLEQARREATAARARAATANADVARQQQAYGDALATSYAVAPQLTTMAAMMDADGVTGVMERLNALSSAEDAMNSQYDQFRATSTLATIAQAQAKAAQEKAAALETEMQQARDAAAAAADAAAAEARTVTDQKQQLISELAHLQHVSVQIAQQRQSALEARAAAAAQAAAEQAAQEAAQQAAEQAAQEAAQQAAEQAAQQQHDGDNNGNDNNDNNGNAPSPEPSAPPAPSGSAVDRAISFAKDQLGEPYVWGATGPDSWDCSGLTMRSWEAGGISLPHYSVAQYDESTPIAPSDLRPGDLVFWGDSNDSSSIYHVAMYIGDGQIIQAPRTGRDVEIVSMYYWIPPNFYARP
jgi:cell wall-associated NlpC family hydrolase